MMAKDTSFLLEDSGKAHYDYITRFVKAEKGKTDSNNNLEFIKSTVEDWLKTMRNVIDDRQKHDEEVNDERVGLRNEMDYWKHRYYKLNSIDEQLNSPNNKLIYNMLEFFITLSSSLSQDSSSSKHKQLDRIQKQIQTYKPDFESKQKDYKELENELNRYLTEAKNNDK
jgi:chromosome segregation ATPase